MSKQSIEENVLTTSSWSLPATSSVSDNSSSAFFSSEQRNISWRHIVFGVFRRTELSRSPLHTFCFQLFQVDFSQSQLLLLGCFIRRIIFYCAMGILKANTDTRVIYLFINSSELNELTKTHPSASESLEISSYRAWVGAFGFRLWATGSFSSCKMRRTIINEKWEMSATFGAADRRKESYSI